MTDHCLEESRGLSGGTPQGLPACPCLLYTSDAADE